ncbi:MAG: hypothetical protein ACTSVZ_09825 [Promethearchaeota archaeon]
MNMKQQSEERIFAQYIDGMLKSLRTDKFDKEILRSSILTELLANRQALLKKDSHTSSNPEELSNPSKLPNPPKSSNPDLDEETIRAKAEEIAGWQNSYDTLIWLLAKSSLELKSGVEPTAEVIIPIAEHYALTEKDIDKIHWYLAENILKLQQKN